VEAVSTIEGKAYPFGLKNIDTDVIIPAAWLKTISRTGLGKGAFEALRKEPGNLFDDAQFAGAPILIAGDNFGCGSSREHAVWGMRQLGIDACIGTGFAGIFYDNARKNGLALPVVSPEVRDLFLQFSSDARGKEISIDLERRTITTSGINTTFEMDDATQVALIRGRDDTLDSLEHAGAIRDYEEALQREARVSVIK
jgi:3-isopropylmalate/(R)-2-methylmalate dehydratase small subunit